MSKRNYTDEQVVSLIQDKSNLTVSSILKKLGSSLHGESYSLIKQIIKKYDLDVSHWEGIKVSRGIPKGSKIGYKRDISEYLVLNCKFKSTSHWIKNRLFDEGIKKKQCEECNGVEWMGQPMPLSLHHINGNKRDNRLENLEILCSNCHSLTDNYCTKNWK